MTIRLAKTSDAADLTRLWNSQEQEKIAEDSAAGFIADKMRKIVVEVQGQTVRGFFIWMAETLAIWRVGAGTSLKVADRKAIFAALLRAAFEIEFGPTVKP